MKTGTIRVGIGLAVKAGLKTAAGQERRPIANMVEVLIRDYRGRNVIEIAETDTPNAARRGGKPQK